jgi:capsid protein
VIYREWMEQALLLGTATGGAQGLVLDSRPLAKLLAVKWGGRGWLSPDPLKDMNAAVLAIENGLGSRHSYLAEAGEDWEETLEELARESQDAATAGISVSSAEAKADAAAALATATTEEAAAATDRAVRRSPNGKAKKNAVLIGAD